ncbi:MAG: LPS-assembly protein LptD [Alphaproteobacteria bacterium]|jgi:LPS-assembly protein|nr:LPS-assembly protein LptD [Alphaproteobacteria bacterium]MBT4086451.1 LPS-assembly protein LptD [Alphaproteobacteria bacterium]MBT4546431.1 LPS-assembly protein LptD [Alphaproteobacteria bacterium]MBT7747674.1 LPS-assembly protein LptD [Alphaproteobacteria bacterium]
MRILKRRLSRFALWTILVLAQTGNPVLAQSANKQDDVLFSADAMSHDQELGIVQATGNVEIASGDRILRADAVSYNQRTEVVSASGNVAIMEPTGEVLFVDYAELEEGLKTGFVKSLRLLLTDKSRFAAASAVRQNGNKTVMSRAVYSACNLCPKNPDRAPLWQIKAIEVVHNQAAKRIDYKDAFLEVYGVPILYTPFFSHPDPTVKAKTGILAPRYGSSTDLGGRIDLPYYIRLSEHRDATITPTVTTKEGLILAAEYREKTATGEWDVDASITRADERDSNNSTTGRKIFRGHTYIEGEFQLDPVWRWGVNARRTLDDTYLRRYDISSTDNLTSNLYIEGFNGPHYASANAYAFQGLRESDDPGDTPIVLPSLEYNWRGQPNESGDRFAFDANVLSLYRSDGQDTRRLSMTSSWQRPVITDGGSIINFSALVRGDGYHVTSMPDPSNPGTTKDGFRSRMLTQAAVDWRLPFVRQDGSVRQVIEPVAMAIISPYGGNPTGIPNEDSLSFEFDDTNLLSKNRFPGIDKWEGGPRANFGIRTSVYGASGGYTTAMLGQTWRFKADSTFGDRTGLEDQRSDYVGRLLVSPSKYLDYVHRLRLDRDSFTIRRNEFDLSLGPDAYRFNVGYLSLSQELAENGLSSREEIRFSGKAELTKFWSASAHSRRDLTADGGSINHGLGLTYEDECVVFSSQYDRTFTVDRDIRPASTFYFKVSLKHLG